MYTLIPSFGRNPAWVHKPHALREDEGMKRAIKWLVYGTIFVLVLPSGLLARLGTRVPALRIFYGFFAEAYSLVPGVFGTVARVCFYKQTLRKAHLDLVVGFNTIISKMDDELGRGVLIGARSTIGRAKVGDHAVIANCVSILSGRYEHNFQDPSKNILAGADTFSCVNIGSHAFIGEKCVVMADVGEYTIVGAGSVVSKPLPPFVVAVGNPARIVKERPRPAQTVPSDV